MLSTHGPVLELPEFPKRTRDGDVSVHLRCGARWSIAGAEPRSLWPELPSPDRLLVPSRKSQTRHLLDCGRHWRYPLRNVHRFLNEHIRPLGNRASNEHD